MRRLLFLLFMSPALLLAQFSDNFSDGDFSTNPVWLGHTSFFKISTSTAIPSAMRPGLQLDNTVGDTSILYVNNNMTLTDSLEWTCWVKLSFNPTSGNNARYYLVSSQTDLNGSLNGYYIGIGETSDKLSLVRQDGTSKTTLITGTVANLNKTTNEIRIKVKRDNAGLWSLLSDTTGGTNYLLEGSAIDNTYSSGLYTGIYCLYTSSNATKFYFDDFYAGPIVVDTIPPEVISVNALTAFQLDVFYNELPDPATASDAANYSVDQGVGVASLAQQDIIDPLKYSLTFSNPVPEGILCMLHVEGVQDKAGNTIVPVDVPFAYYTPRAFDVVINEIMADPTPVVLLPAYEFIELKNITALPISLDNWTLYIGTTDYTLNDIILNPNAYLILCSDDAASDLDDFGNVYSFSSFAITNDGADISLLDATGKIISFAGFTSDWYQDSYKDDGGWSVEQIDPLNPCLGYENWKASVSIYGGTPGTINSINASNPDNADPALIRASIMDDYQIEIFFSESMDSALIANPANYSLDNGLTFSTAPQGIPPYYSTAYINFTSPIQAGIIYTLSITDTITDCVGNILPISSSVRFAFADSLEANDLVINEVLADPADGISDYVEIYNRSSKILDMRLLVLATIDPSTGLLESQKNIAPNGFLVFPGEYFVLTTDPPSIRDYYYCQHWYNFIEMESFPTFSNESGIVVLAYSAGNIIDRLGYNIGMYDPILTSTDGVAIERINFDRPSYDSTNWHAAASTVGFGTPTYLNSQYSNTEGESELTIEPAVFSPDNDGYYDVQNILFTFSEGGGICNIDIFDASGRFIKHIARNEIIGTHAVFSWDGSNEYNEKCPIGMYVLLAEVLLPDGSLKKYKKVLVLGGRF